MVSRAISTIFQRTRPIPVPAGISVAEAACAPLTFATVEHMLFDNAKLEPGETVLVHAGGSGIGSAAIRLAKDIGAIVITTVGDDEKMAKALALGADHVINYRKDRFEGVVRKLTNKIGVDVVFEHIGPEHLERLAALPQARRPPRHLRLHVGAIDHHESHAAVPAAVSHFRLVRIRDPQRARRTCEDGARSKTCDR